eukprot:944511-Rhodomonas_salina.2
MGERGKGVGERAKGRVRWKRAAFLMLTRAIMPGRHWEGQETLTQGGSRAGAYVVGGEELVNEVKNGRLDFDA